MQYEPVQQTKWMISNYDERTCRWDLGEIFGIDLRADA